MLAIFEAVSGVYNRLTIEGFNRKKELNARIPSLVINERVAFESGIPVGEELMDKIHEFLQDSYQGK